MARVNVEQKALTDSRFGSLGLMLLNKEIGSAANDVSIETAQSLGIGRMVRVWNECQERNTYTLSDVDLLILLGHEESGQFLIDSGLGERVKGGRIRIVGTKDRIEWLTTSRNNGPKGAPHGVKGGRPKKTPDGVSNKPPVGLPEKPPPAPAPAPAPTEKKNKKLKGAATSKELVEAFSPNAGQREWASTAAPSVPIETELEAWRDRCRANGYTTSKAPIKSAEASWRTAMRNAERFKTYADRTRTDYGRSHSRQTKPSAPAARDETPRTIYKLRPASEFCLDPIGESETGDLYVVPASGKS